MTIKSKNKKRRNRIRLSDEENNYFLSEKTNLEFVSSGCAILDCVLGGGYALGDMTNIIGDKSTCKTHLGTEAITNFILQYPEGQCAYRDVEAAFDVPYAEAMGLPIDRIDFGEDNFDTVEALFKDLSGFIKNCREDDIPGIYVLDSLDALSDEAELKRDITEGTYGGNKPKLLGQLFRRLARDIEKSRVLFIIISQLRENIGAFVGEKYRRAGGRAMDFYASQFLWLTHKGKIPTTRKGIKRVTGIKLGAQIKKNKIGFPFRDCDMEFIFGFGIDDIISNLIWLDSVNRLNMVDLQKKDLSQNSAFRKELEIMNSNDYNEERQRVANAVLEAWPEVESTFLPTRSKYGN